MKPDDVQTLLITGAHRLTAAGCDTPSLDTEVLLAHILGHNRAWLYTHPQASPTPGQLDQFYHLLRRREQREPVAYLTGAKEFFGLEFYVNPNVLIPRPETELLVETALELLMANSPLIIHHSPFTIIDVGAGSGCIAVSLAKNLPAARLAAIDMSAGALDVARRNAIRHGVADRISFLQGDLLQPVAGPVEMIVSNPPYVSRAELAATAPEIRQYEPALALAGGDDGLDVIRVLLAQARQKLKPGGWLLVEIGATQGAAVTRLAQKQFPRSQFHIKKDLAGLDRLLITHLI